MSDELDKRTPQNYMTTCCGIEVRVEYDVGDVRHEKILQYPYGEIPETMAADGDPLDVVLGPYDDAPMAYVVHQHFPMTGAYDEDKLYLGFDSAVAAKIAYLTQYSPSHFGAISAIPVYALRKQLRRTNEVLPKLGEPLFMKAYGSQGLADYVGRSTKLGSELLMGKTLVVHAQGVESIPVSLTQAVHFATQTSAAKSLRDCCMANAEMFSDFSKALTLTTHVDSLLNRPRQSSVLLKMFGCAEHLQITDGIVKSVPVFMVDDFIAAKLPPKELLHDVPMFRDLTAANPNVPVRCLGLVTPKPALAKALRRVRIVEEQLHKSLNAEAIKNPPAGNRRVQTGGGVNFVYNSGPGPRAKPEVDPNMVEYLREASGTIERERARRVLTVAQLQDLNAKTPVKIFPLNSDGTNKENPYDINEDDDRAASAEIGQQILEVGRKQYSNMVSSPARNNDSPEVRSTYETSDEELKVKRTG